MDQKLRMDEGYAAQYAAPISLHLSHLQHDAARRHSAHVKCTAKSPSTNLGKRVPRAGKHGKTKSVHWIIKAPQALQSKARAKNIARGA